MSYLPGGFDALAEAEEDDGPGHEEAQHQLPLEFPQILDPFRHVQHVIPVETSSRSGEHELTGDTIGPVNIGSLGIQ